ncbi:hypothetical protein ACFVT5_13740 [Streptomyces sp. NPDC058001]|uniref:hypothetical protein n=1 Tax=Streptomyces sp. NPDC058001 TaxID=3346300 RepID=UPI0036F12493
MRLSVNDGAFSAMDLTARHPRTGELLSTVKFMVQTLAAAGELQRDLQRELTYDGLRAAEAKGSKGGRRPAVAAAKSAAVRTGYLEGRSIGALARDHRVSRGAIRTAVADLLPDHTAIEEDSPVRVAVNERPTRRQVTRRWLSDRRVARTHSAVWRSVVGSSGPRHAQCDSIEAADSAQLRQAIEEALVQDERVHSDNPDVS